MLGFNDNSNKNSNENFSCENISNNIIQKSDLNLINIRKKNLKLANIGNLINNHKSEEKKQLNSNTKNHNKSTFSNSKLFLEEHLNDKNKIIKTEIKSPAKTRNTPKFVYSAEEKYSLLKIKKMKSFKFSPYKSTNYLYNNAENIFDKENHEQTKNLCFPLKNKKKIYSLKKVYISNINFFTKDKELKGFKIFRDNDIGLDSDLINTKIKMQTQDDDIDSSDEMSTIGQKICLQKIENAIQLFQKGTCPYIAKYKQYFNLKNSFHII